MHEGDVPSVFVASNRRFLSFNAVACALLDVLEAACFPGPENRLGLQGSARRPVSVCVFGRDLSESSPRHHYAVVLGNEHRCSRDRKSVV